MAAWRDLAPLFLRVALGAVMIAHGHDKVFGGMDGIVRLVSRDLGLHWSLAYAAAYAEFFGGFLVLIGLMTRWAALFIAATMAVAVFLVKWPDGLRDGYQFPLSLLAAALALVFTGGGWLSMDRHVVKKEF